MQKRIRKLIQNYQNYTRVHQRLTKRRRLNPQKAKSYDFSSMPIVKTPTRDFGEGTNGKEVESRIMEYVQVPKLKPKHYKSATKYKEPYDIVQNAKITRLFPQDILKQPKKQSIYSQGPYGQIKSHYSRYIQQRPETGRLDTTQCNRREYCLDFQKFSRRILISTPVRGDRKHRQ